MQPNPRFWSGKIVCVTGGSGYLGFHLVQQLRGLGARVRVLCMPPAEMHPLRNLADIETYFGDILDSSLVSRAVRNAAVVIHTAGIVAVWGPALKRMHEVNVGGTRELLRHCDSNARIVHTSSVVAVGASLDGKPLEETSFFNLTGTPVDYIHAKRDSEIVALEAGKHQDVVVVNPGYLVGPEDYEGSVMTRLCARFWRGRMPMLPPGGLNLVDVRDVALGHLLAAEHGKAGRRYILGNENLRFPEIARKLAQAARLHPRPMPTLPLWMLRSVASIGEWRGKYTLREPYPSHQHVEMQKYLWFFDSVRARQELGFAPRPLSETLEDMYRWHVQRHPIHLRGFPRWLMRPAA